MKEKQKGALADLAIYAVAFGIAKEEAIFAAAFRQTALHVRNGSRQHPPFAGGSDRSFFEDKTLKFRMFFQCFFDIDRIIHHGAVSILTVEVFPDPDAAQGFHRLPGSGAGLLRSASSNTLLIPY